jgi:hypothetical protein
LTPLSSVALERLQSELAFTRVEAGAGGRALAARLAESGAAGADGGSGEYWIIALAGVLGLLVFEMALTRYWWASGGGG